MHRAPAVSPFQNLVSGAASQIRAAWSQLAVTMQRPSGLNPALQTLSRRPLSSPRRQALSAAQTRAVPSQLAVTMRRPSGLYVALRTLSPWPFSTATRRPLLVSHNRAILSLLAVTAAGGSCPPLLEGIVVPSRPCATPKNYATRWPARAACRDKGVHPAHR